MSTFPISLSPATSTGSGYKVIDLESIHLLSLVMVLTLSPRRLINFVYYMNTKSNLSLVGWLMWFRMLLVEFWVRCETKTRFTVLCGSLRDRIQPWLRDYVRLQSLAVFLIYTQVNLIPSLSLSIS